MRYKHMAYRTWNEVGAHVSQEIVTSGGSRLMLFGQLNWELTSQTNRSLHEHA